MGVRVAQKSAGYFSESAQVDVGYWLSEWALTWTSESSDLYRCQDNRNQIRV